MATNWAASDFTNNYSTAVQGAKSAQDAANWYNKYNYARPGATPAAGSTAAAPIGPAGTTAGVGGSPTFQSGNQQYAGATVPNAVPQGVGTTGTTAPIQNAPTIQTAFRDQLLSQLQTNPNNVSLNDPSLRPQVQANQNAQQRAMERLQQDLAETGFVGGTGRTGAYRNELANAGAQRAEQEGGFEAGLLGQEKQQRLASLFNALGLGQQQIQGDENLRVQRELGLGDLNAKNKGLDIQKTGQQGQLGLGLLQAMLGDRNNNNQLGLNAALGGANLNMNAVIKALGL